MIYFLKNGTEQNNLQLSSSLCNFTYIKLYMCYRCTIYIPFYCSDQSPTTISTANNSWYRSVSPVDVNPGLLQKV